MKKIIIVIDNMSIGGVQKSLSNLLVNIHDKYDISLLIFSKDLNIDYKIPKNVKILNSNFWLNLIGTPLDSLKSPVSKIFKMVLIFLSKIFSAHFKNF